jgi:branched-chain amino acid transport system ATP-binding protein
MIALHHWRDNTVSALDAPHVCTAVVRHAKSAGDSNKGNGSSATQPQAKVPARPQRTTASKTTGHAPKARRAEAETKAQTKHGRDMILGDTILETRGLTKEFKGFTAVNGVNLRVRRGSIHALIGPNGAGKTTCFNLLTKFLEPTAGQIVFNGVDITGERPAQVARRGVIRSFQISAVFPHLTVMQNVRIGLQRSLGTSFKFWKSERVLDALDDRAMDLLTQVGLTDFADTTTVELSYGRKRALEIATTLSMEPELMLLDEPTQGMGHEDVDRVTALIKKVSAGRTILMVEHNMNVIAGISDTITVLQRGEVLAEGSYAEVSKNALVMEAYMGSADAALAGAHA